MGKTITEFLNKSHAPLIALGEKKVSWDLEAYSMLVECCGSGDGQIYSFWEKKPRTQSDFRKRKPPDVGVTRIVLLIF